jgi:hypothetical protein
MFTGQSRNCICDRDFSRTLLRTLSPQFRRMGRDGMGVTPGSAATTEEKRGSEEARKWAWAPSQCAAACGSSSLLSPCLLASEEGREA